MRGVRTYKRFACDISEKESTILSKLVSSGAIFNLYQRAKTTKVPHCIFICRKNVTGNIIGWSVIIKMRYYTKPKYEFMVYIKRKYRRNGLGTFLYKKCKSFFKLFHHDIVVYQVGDNKTFFNKIRNKGI